MKKHAIIPVFIPHEGCPNDCVFCNQKKITARSHAEDRVDIDEIAGRYLSTLKDPRPDVIEMAMFGGSFTGIPMERQNEYLSKAKEYKDAGLIDKIHLSTRPDYIDRAILDNLRRWGVDVIELGVQSFDDEVLEKSGRGHDSSVVYESCRLIKEYGFSLGIQLMVGLPGDTDEKAVFSAREAVSLAPDVARLYPTVIIEETELMEMYRRGEYRPLSLEEAVQRTKAMYKIIAAAGIQIIRVGLKSSDIINEDGEICGASFHPAIRQLVEGDIARDEIENQLDTLLAERPESTGLSGTASGRSEVRRPRAVISANSRSLSNAVGLNGRNRSFFEEKYKGLRFSFQREEGLSDYEYAVRLQ